MAGVGVMTRKQYWLVDCVVFENDALCWCYSWGSILGVLYWRMMACVGVITGDQYWVCCIGE